MDLGYSMGPRVYQLPAVKRLFSLSGCQLGNAAALFSGAGEVSGSSL